MTTPTQTGTVKWFNEAKGFGFIAQDAGGADLFAHFRDITGSGFKTLVENQRVEFEVKQGQRACRPRTFASSPEFDPHRAPRPVRESRGLPRLFFARRRGDARTAAGGLTSGRRSPCHEHHRHDDQPPVPPRPPPERPAGARGLELHHRAGRGQVEDGGVLVKTLALSLDPAMRGWMNEGKSYIPPVGIGEVMRAGGVGTVIASKSPAFAVGDTVYGTLGVQEYAAFDRGPARQARAQQIDLRLGTMTQWLNVLGMPGHDRLLRPPRRRPAEARRDRRRLGAAGAVGQTVGQLAKIKGCRAVGIAGGPAKCDGW
jgi:cold shock CspA family protein